MTCLHQGKHKTRALATAAVEEVGGVHVEDENAVDRATHSSIRQIWCDRRETNQLQRSKFFEAKFTNKERTLVANTSKKPK